MQYIPRSPTICTLEKKERNQFVSVFALACSHDWRINSNISHLQAQNTNSCLSLKQIKYFVIQNGCFFYGFHYSNLTRWWHGKIKSFISFLHGSLCSQTHLKNTQPLSLDFLGWEFPPKNIFHEKKISLNIVSGEW